MGWDIKFCPNLFRLNLYPYADPYLNLLHEVRHQSLPRLPCFLGCLTFLLSEIVYPKLAHVILADVRWGMRWVDIYFYIFKEESWPICTGLWTKHLLVLILCSWLELCSTRNILLVEAPIHLPQEAFWGPALRVGFFDGPVMGGPAWTAPVKWEMIRGVMGVMWGLNLS